MGQFLMSAITTIGGVIGILVGVAFVGVVIVVGLVPILLTNRRGELKENDEDDLKIAHDRMSAHI